MAGDVEDARRCFEDLGEGRITEHLREGPFLTTLRFVLGLACLLIVLAMRLWDVGSGRWYAVLDLSGRDVQLPAAAVRLLRKSDDPVSIRFGHACRLANHGKHRHVYE